VLTVALLPQDAEELLAGLCPASQRRVVVGQDPATLDGRFQRFAAVVEGVAVVVLGAVRAAQVHAREAVLGQREVGTNR